MKRRSLSALLALVLVFAALPLSALPVFAEETPVTAVRLNVAAPAPGGSYAPGELVSVPEDAPYRIALCIWTGPDGDNAVTLNANEPHTLRVIVSSRGAQYPFANDVALTVDGADGYTVESAGRSAIMLVVTVSAKVNEIETVKITVRPPVAGTKSIEIPPQAVLTSDGCTLQGIGWMYGLHMYTTEELDVTFEEGQTYYMMVYLKADDGLIFKKSDYVYTGVDEGAVRFDGCAVEGGTLEFAASRTLNTDYAKGDFLTVKISVTAVKAPDGPAYVLGDVDGKDGVTAADARLALRAAVGLESYAPGSREFLAADADVSGDLTAADARLILRRAVGFADAEWGGRA